MEQITVTVDTNNLAPGEMARLEASADGLPIQFAHVSVSDREMAGFAPPLPSAQILETAVWGESQWGAAVWGSNDEAARFERLLSLISRGTFPRAAGRDNLTRGQQRHLRDAMIVSAHIREDRDILVSNDWTRTPSLLPAVRDLIAVEFPNIRIMTSHEFVAYCASLR